MCCTMCTEYRYSSLMSCTGQSDATHSTSIDTDEAHEVGAADRRVVPARRRAGPITRTM